MLLQIVIGFFLWFLSNDCVAQKSSDLIIFSYDRPMQLYALLESIEKYVYGLNDTYVIYRASSDQYEEAYKIIFERFRHIHFYRQSSQPKKDFKDLTMQVISKLASDYVMFAVDDIIVIDFVDLSLCIALIEILQAYGVYLRLGTHLTYCYTMQQPQPVPKFDYILEDICIWQFEDGILDWKYPNTVDMTVYRKQDVMEALKPLTFFAPNSLEGSWAAHASKVLKKKGIFFEHTKIINIPLNRVQQECPNINMEAYDTHTLLEFFMNGLKIDIAPLFRINNNAAHMAYMPSFIPRS